MRSCCSRTSSIGFNYYLYSRSATLSKLHRPRTCCIGYYPTIFLRARFSLQNYPIGSTKRRIISSILFIPTILPTHSIVKYNRTSDYSTFWHYTEGLTYSAKTTTYKSAYNFKCRVSYYFRSLVKIGASIILKLPYYHQEISI